MNRLYKIFLILIVIFGLQEAKASHMMGGDIAYECISPGKYKLVIKVYRDCRGIPFNSPDIRVFCKDGSNSNSVNYTRTAINDLTPTCTGGTAPCNPQNTPSSEGIEEHVFEAVIDFNTNPFKAMKDAGCCEVMIKVEQCCRNGAITTISPGNFYTDAMLDICNIGKKCNTSPQLSIPPVAYVCCNQPFTYNNGVREVIDGDSLSYDLSTPLNANNSNETYTGNFNANIPMTPYCPPNPGVVNCRALPNAKPPRGFYFDRETGDIVFTPTKCDEVGIIVIQITEWRKDSTKKWKKIGFTRRDMQIVVKQCPDNNPPSFTGNNKYSVCEGNKICFTIGTKDEPFLPKQTRLDTVALTWNYGIPSATFTIVDPTAREKEALFCWQTKIGDARPNPYTFTATAKDDNCPRPASANRGYLVSVKPKARDTRQYDILDCGKFRFTAHPVDTVNYDAKNYRYKFTIRDSTNSGLPLYFGFYKKDSMKFKRGGKYIIEHEINNPPYNCPTIYTDTVIIPPVLDVELAFGKDTFVCAGNSITLEPVISHGVPTYKYRWEAPMGTFNPKDTFSSYTLVKPTATTRLLLTLTDKNKCVDSDTILVRYQPNPIVDIGPDRRICTYDNITLDAQNDDTMRYYWLPNGDSTRTITVNIAGKYIAKVIDHLGCNTSDTMELFVNDTVIAIAKPHREICILDTLKVTGKRMPLGYTRQITWRDIGTGVTMATDSFFKTKITTMTPKDYEMYLRVNQGGVVCEDKDTFTLLVNALPTFQFAGLPPRCYADGAINLTQNQIAKAFSGDKSQTETDLRYYQQYKKPSWVTGGPVGVNTYVYDFPKFITNAQVPKAGLRDTICYEYKDYKGCYNKECKPTRLNPNPDVNLYKDRSFCQKAGPIELDQIVERPFSKVGGIQSFRVLDVPPGSGVDPAAILSIDYNSTPNKTMMDPGQEGENEKTGAYLIEYCFKDAITGCQTCDSEYVYVIRIPEIQFTGFPKLCINDSLLTLDSFVIDRNTGRRFNLSEWSTVEYGGSRDLSNPNIAPKILNSMVDKKYFDPQYGAGQYLVKIFDNSSGCPVSDSTEILVNGLPIIQINVPDTVCSSSPPFTLNNILPSGAVGTWSGVGVTGREFNPGISAKSKQYEGPVRVKFAYTNPLTGCTSSDSQTLLIQSQPEVLISTDKPYQQCEGKVFDLAATKNWASNTIWTTNGDGSFGTASQLSTTYNHGLNDTALNGKAGKVRLTISTVKEGVCPVATDNINLIIEPYPQFNFLADPEIQCEPAIVNFNTFVAKPAGSANLRFNWWFGNGDSMVNSTNFNPQNVRYDTAKRTWYDVTLIVDNKWGTKVDEVCSIRKDSLQYIKVLPQPKAGFSSNPGFFTTVAFPKFNFFNETKVRWSSPGGMSYLWYFGTGDLDDTSTKYSPVHTYTADTMKYYVHLTSTFTYNYKNQDYVCWDSISQLRKIGPDVTVFVPTAFSPEKTGPNANNVFLPIVNGEKTYHIELYNRWGELLWTTDDKFASWDGK